MTKFYDDSPMSDGEAKWTAAVIAAAERKAERRRAAMPSAPARIPSGNQLANFPQGTSCVYVIGEDDQRVVKIGWSTNLAVRLSVLRTASMFDLALLWATDGGPDLETALHDRFIPQCVRGEWLCFPEGDAVGQVQEAVKALRDVRPLPVGVEDIRRDVSA